MAKILFKVRNAIALCNGVIHRIANTEYFTNGPKPIVPVPAISFETLRVSGGSSEFAKLRTGDDTAQHYGLLTFPEKTPPWRHRIGPTYHSQDLGPSGEIAVKEPSGNFKKDSVLSQPYITEACGRLGSHITGMDRQKLRLDAGIEKNARFAAAFGAYDEPPGEPIDWITLSFEIRRFRQRGICF